jgi:hypothetical protein
VIKLQALARARKERVKLQQARKFKEACQQQPKGAAEEGWKSGPAIKGRARKTGDLHAIQVRASWTAGGIIRKPGAAVSRQCFAGLAAVATSHETGDS